MTTEAILVYCSSVDRRWYIGVYDTAKHRMICHIGRQQRGYGTQGAALHDLARITKAQRRYQWWENKGLDWEGAGL